MRTAVVGHIEWIRFLHVDRVPLPGEIARASREWEEPGGGGSVAAVQLARLAGGCDFFTAVGDDETGRRAVEELRALGLTVHAAVRDDAPTRTGVTFVDSAGERTITVVGEKIVPHGDDPLPWERLAEVDATYFCGGDADAVAAARAARVLVATARELSVLGEAAVRVDALVGSAGDESERYEPGSLSPEPGAVVLTEGAAGGTWAAGGESGRYESAQPPGPVCDSYGCGDSFAAGLAHGLAAEGSLEAALSLAARCGAACLTGHGPYEGQLRSA